VVELVGMQALANNTATGNWIWVVQAAGELGLWSFVRLCRFDQIFQDFG